MGVGGGRGRRLRGGKKELVLVLFKLRRDDESFGERGGRRREEEGRAREQGAKMNTEMGTHNSTADSIFLSPSFLTAINVLNSGMHTRLNFFVCASRLADVIRLLIFLLRVALAPSLRCIHTVRPP